MAAGTGFGRTGIGRRGLEGSDSCMNIHVLREVALLSKAFSTDLARELFVGAMNLAVSAAQT